MKFGLFGKIAALMLLTFLLAACGGGATQAPDTGAGTGAATAAPTTAAGGTAGGGAGSDEVCVGVDTVQLASAGQALYEQRCASCHGAQGEGMGDFPALAGDANLTTTNAADLVAAYFAVDAHPKDISADDFAGMFTYVRGAFGNNAPVVCPSDVTIPAQ
jgi:mono/diheme cytochrome c family protein